MRNRFVLIGLLQFLSVAGVSAAPLIDPVRLFQDILIDINQKINTNISCTSILSDYASLIDQVNGGQLDHAAFPERTDYLINKSFQTRLDLRKKIKGLEDQGEFGPECLNAMRNLSRSIRYFEDYLIEAKLKVEGNLGKPEDYITLQGKYPYYLVNQEVTKKWKAFEGIKDLRSGDVIISRGNAYTSAAIARMGENDAQFSHSSLVYVDENGKMHTVEAHIEIGTVALPIDAHIDEKNARTAVYRFHDPILAHLAAKMMYEKAKAQSAKGKNIDYDFALNYRDPQKLFCSEVIYQGYMAASGGSVDVPRYKMKFGSDSYHLLSAFGVQVNEQNITEQNTLAPADFEFDSRFELITEWRNPAKMQESRIKDVIATKIYEWMGTQNYRFDSTIMLNLKVDAAWVLRRIPFIKKFVEDKFPLNMNTNGLRFFAMLDIVGKILREELIRAESGRNTPMSLSEMEMALESYRIKDYTNYLQNRQHHSPNVTAAIIGKRQKVQLHKWFHP